MFEKLSFGFLVNLKSYEEIFGDEMVRIVAAITQNARMDLAIPTIVFIAGVDMDDDAGTARFKGFLPLDGSLDAILVRP